MAKNNKKRKGLTSAELIKNRGGPYTRVNTFLNKIKSGDLFETIYGDKIALDKKQFSNLKTFLYGLVDNKETKPFKVKTANGEYIPSGNLAKTKEFGAAEQNVGTLAEAVLGAALCAKFAILPSTDTNTVENTIELIKKIEVNFDQFKGQGSAIGTFKQQIGNDTISLSIKLDQTNLKVLKDENKIENFLGVVKSAVLFSNTCDDLNQFIKKKRKSKKPANIEIISDGISENTTTKADIKIMVDGKPVDFHISLKACDVKQFGQCSGNNFNQLYNFFKNLFGVDLPQSFANKLEKENGIEALREIYQWASDEFSKKLKLQREKALEDIASGINYFATNNAKENLNLVNLKNATTIAGYLQLNFNQLQEKIKKNNLQLAVKTYFTNTEFKSPIIVVYDPSKTDGQERPTSENTLIVARMKLELNKNRELGFYARNIVESGNILKRLTFASGYEQDKRGNITKIESLS